MSSLTRQNVRRAIFCPSPRSSSKTGDDGSRCTASDIGSDPAGPGNREPTAAKPIDADVGGVYPYPTSPDRADRRRLSMLSRERWEADLGSRLSGHDLRAVKLAAVEDPDPEYWVHVGWNEVRLCKTRKRHM